jgi:hypothetical protein
MYPPVQQLYANKIIKKSKSKVSSESQGKPSAHVESKSVT